MDHSKVAKLWDENAKAWDEASKLGFDIWRDYVNTPTFLNMLPDVMGLTGLDVGCGDGYNSRLIAQKCHFLTAIDVSEQFLKKNQKTKNPPNITYRQISASELPFPNEHFDFATAIMSLMDIAELEKVLSEIYRTLTPNGFFQLSIIHPCFNEHKGKWYENEKGEKTAFLVKNYFEETEGEIHEWQHIKSPAEMKTFRVPRFWKPLNKWLNSLVKTGFILEAFCEPFADDAAIAQHPELASTRIVAHSLIIRARKSEQQGTMQTVIEKLPGNVWWKDKNLVYLGCNDHVINILGLASRKEFIGKKDHDLWEKSIADKLKATDLKVLETKTTLSLEETILDNNGEFIIMLTNKSPLFDGNNNIIGILGTSTNITDRKKFEEELKQAKEKAELGNKAKTEFLENMRHDIRTPLTGIAGFASIIKEEIDNPKIKEYIDNLIASSDALLELLNEVLEAVKVSSGEIPLLKKKFDLKSRLQSIVTLNQAKIKEKRIELIFDYDKQLPHYFIGDSTRIHRLILELITNAINFTSQGHIKLSALLAKQHGHEIIVKIIVEDTGVGILSDKKEEIFLQFKRLTPSYEGIYKGAGLGLAIVKQFIDDLEGEIYVETAPQKGTRFTCLIPLHESLLNDDFGSETVINIPERFSKTKHFTTSKVEPSYDSHASTNHNSILLIEDNSLAAKIAQAVLSSLSCKVDIASDGKTAIEKAQNGSYDLIFMDIGLPGMNGYEITKKIRALEFITKKHIPIIALTAHVDTENKQNCIEAGMNAVLNKPLIKEKALDILNAFIPSRVEKAQLSSKSQTPENIEYLSTQGKVFNRKKALEILNGDEKYVNEVMTLLVSELKDDKNQLKGAFQNNDWQTIQTISHRLKGATSYCGAERLNDACGKLEGYLKKKALELQEPLYKQLLIEIQALETEINRIYPPK